MRDLAALIARRLGRPSRRSTSGTRASTAGRYSEAELDEVVRGRYPTVEAFQAKLPECCAAGVRAGGGGLVGSGSGPTRRAARPRDGRRAARGQAAHETACPGRNGLQGLQHRRPRAGAQRRAGLLLNAIDHGLLAASQQRLHEAMAFVFQNRDLELLGSPRRDPKPAARRPSHALEHLRDRRRGPGRHAGLELDVRAPGASRPTPCGGPRHRARGLEPWYARTSGERLRGAGDLLAHDRHGLYLPDYPIGTSSPSGRRRLRGESFGAEFERVTRQGRLTPTPGCAAQSGAPLRRACSPRPARRCAPSPPARRLPAHTAPARTRPGS